MSEQTPQRLTLTARYVFPVEGPPIERGRVVVEGGRIAEVGPAPGGFADINLGNAAILPGFVNAHTHLELSPVAPAPEDGAEDLITWLKRVVAHRRTTTVEELRAAVARNLRASIAAGTTLLADITTAGLSWNAIAEAPVRAVVFAEVIGLKSERAEQTLESATGWLDSITPEAQVAACARPGLSPHAPYSTSRTLYHAAAGRGVPLTTHLAELPGEREFLERRTGPIREFLESIGAWDPNWTPLGSSPADYIRKGDLKRADWLIAHGNYLEADDYWQLHPASAPEGQRVAVAFCPRTHARFGHPPHPFRAMLERGIVVCLGTDSLASVPTLSVLDEARFLRRSDPTLGGPLLLTMATLFGAWALRAETVTGSLRPGKSADLAVVALPEHEAGDPHDLVLDSDLPVLATMFEGRFVAGPLS